MPRLERKRREKAGKVRPGGAWEKKRGWDVPLGAEKKRKSGKSKTRRGMGEKKGLECPAWSKGERKRRYVCKLSGNKKAGTTYRMGIKTNRRDGKELAGR